MRIKLQHIGELENLAVIDNAQMYSKTIKEYNDC